MKAHETPELEGLKLAGLAYHADGFANVLEAHVDVWLEFASEGHTLESEVGADVASGLPEACAQARGTEDVPAVGDM